MAWFMEMMSEEAREDETQLLDLLHMADPKIKLSLQEETFLRAAVSLKNQSVLVVAGLRLGLRNTLRNTWDRGWLDWGAKYRMID
ncbi:hypothetical protein ACLOJK_016350 [Asimina triloba]